MATMYLAPVAPDTTIVQNGLNLVTIADRLLTAAADDYERNEQDTKWTHFDLLACVCGIGNAIWLSKKA